MSAVARIVSALSRTDDRNGQVRYSRAIASSPASPWAARYSASADPSPNQPGRPIRDWDQAKTHGMARRDESDDSRRGCPRAGGRDPMASRDSSSMGVAVRK